MKTKQVLVVMKIISWIIFIALCINVAVLIISFFVSLFINPEASKSLHLGFDLSSLYEFSLWYYISMMSLFVLLVALKAHIFYLVIRIFSKLNLKNPFSLNVVNLISKISYVALSIGVMTYLTNSYKIWFVKKGFELPIHSGSHEFLFMAGILFIIASVFKRGIEIQSENDLTI